MNDAGVPTWDEAFGVLSNHVREAFHRCFPPFKNDGDVAPDIVALRDAFYAFPVPTDVLLIDSAKVQPVEPRLYMDNKKEEGPIWTLVTHHISETPGHEITFHGTRPLAEFSGYCSMLTERFGFRDDDGTLEIIKDLKNTGFRDYQSLDIVDFVPFDIRERPETYAKYFSESLLMDGADMLVPKFKKEINYNATYGLQKDPVLSLDDWTKIDPTTAMFVNLLDSKPPTFQERQEAVFDILLIPKVPQDIQRTFQRAKDIYVAGYFRYDFYTVAIHYAALAIEAAIKARWTVTLPQNVTLTCGGKTKDMVFPSHTKIFKFLMKEKWDRNKTLVDGKPFPGSTEKLLDWLEREGIVTKWERGRLRIGINMRNALSHVEHSSTHIPSSNELRFTARLINALFHSLP